MAYVAPFLRKSVKTQITSLAPENFPEFGSTQRTPLSHQNFLAQVKQGEARRLCEQKESIYDPTKINNLTHSQLRIEGWEVLTLGNSKSWFINWNERLLIDAKPVVPYRAPISDIVAFYDDDSDYESYDSESE